MDVEATATGAVLAPEAEISPQSRGLDKNVHALAVHEILIAAGRDVFAQGVRDVGVDVVLRRAGRVIGRCLLTVDRTPREERTALGKLLRAPAHRTKHVVTETQLAARHLRRGVGEERNHEDLGIPEVVPAVAGAGHTLGGHSRLLGARRSLGHLEKIPANRLLQSWLAVHNNVGTLPEPGQPLPLSGKFWFDAVLVHPIKSPPAAINELPGRHSSRRVVGTDL